MPSVVTTGANNRLIQNTISLDTMTATSQLVGSQLKEREVKMTEDEKAVAMEITYLLENRTRMDYQGLHTRMIRQQSGNLCKD